MAGAVFEAFYGEVCPKKLRGGPLSGLEPTMCVFSKSVISVSGTNIFARSTGNGRQLLVYSMTLNAKEELAMILPIPVRPGSGENAVRFINLKDYPDFFVDLKIGWMETRGRGGGFGGATG